MCVGLVIPCAGFLSLLSGYYNIVSVLAACCGCLRICMLVWLLLVLVLWLVCGLVCCLIAAGLYCDCVFVYRFDCWWVSCDWCVVLLCLLFLVF